MRGSASIWRTPTLTCRASDWSGRSRNGSMGASVWSELRERVAPCYSQTSDMRLCGRWRVPVASLKAKQGSSMTHGDANENDDVLACASTAAIAEHGQASRAIWILGASG